MPEIKDAIIQKFHKIAKKYVQTLEKTKTWTVVAGICRVKGNFLEVISLATGTRADQLDPKGLKLHDSHAEVLCRRAAVRFLMFEYLDFVKNLKYEKFACRKQLFTQHLKSYTYHLYVSKVPCGDAAIYGSYSTGARLLNQEKEDWENQKLGKFRLKPGRNDKFQAHWIGENICLFENIAAGKHKHIQRSA